MTRAERVAAQIQNKLSFRPEIACVLGSGWGDVCEFITDAVRVDYGELAEMPACTVKGHRGAFVFGRLFGRRVCVAQGRFHLYEGKSAEEAVLPVAVMYALGAEKLLVTNASGAINADYRAGDLMAICDHINLSGTNPLVGISGTSDRPVFVDMTKAYDGEYLAELEKIGGGDIIVHRGVYAQLSGPSYETPAEIRYLKTAGADAVGMSTAVEVIFARYLGMRVAGISCLTNAAAGLGEGALDHADVLAVSRDRKQVFYEVLEKFIPKM